MRFQALHELTRLRAEDAVPYAGYSDWTAVVMRIGTPAQEACDPRFFAWTMSSHDMLDGEFRLWSWLISNVMRTFP